MVCFKVLIIYNLVNFNICIFIIVTENAFTFRQDTCTLKFNADTTHFKNDGWYAVALTIEDFPKAPITIDNTTYNETTPITQVPLQVNQRSHCVIQIRSTCILF